jgi:hypothetical protein
MGISLAEPIDWFQWSKLYLDIWPAFRQVANPIGSEVLTQANHRIQLFPAFKYKIDQTLISHWNLMAHTTILCRSFIVLRLIVPHIFLLD